MVKIRRTQIVIIAASLLLLALALAFILGRILEKRTYKLEYPELIKLYSEEYSLDPYLVASVIHIESSNKPDAISSAGALGLMQVMPETGEWIANKLSVEPFSTEMLFEPKLNIRFGCWYLQFLTQRFKADRVLVLAAYNAGHGNVEKWLKNPTLSEKGQLTQIPFRETKNYVEKVQRAYEKYKRLYKNSF
ncbi:MAG TPA: lytic transglycosylase domain-containing protein [Clostridia bacterium]|nr:lytic transglycosylase domain-containing protein [Clostridia bacterium]HOR13484.1 lytic transglycosylase domain-containing protein [Clostridia bacterium]